ncbi:MAG: ArnT family glycosyltransferase [Limisphaerales bacterium]
MNLMKPPSGGPSPSGESSSWTRRFWVLLGAVVAVRLVYAAIFPLDLAPDESYYWDWGRRLDYGYFSKPPMIGWLMGLAGRLGGNSEVGIKIFPVLLASGGLVFVFLLGRDLYGAKAGFWAVIVLLAAPANAALNVFFTIDAPLFLFWSASLWAAWRFMTSEGNQRLAWPFLLTLSLGLGYLTKQIQLVFPLLWVGFAAAAKRNGKPNRWGRILGVVGLSLVFLIPPLVWNWQHDWITFRHTADELETAPFRWRRSAKFVGEFLGGQAGLGGGILWILMMMAAVNALARWRNLGDRERYLLVFSIPGLVAFGALSFHQRVEQNWPLVFYPAVAILLAGWVWGGAGGDRWRGWFRGGVVLGAVLGVLLMAVPFVFPASQWAGLKVDPTARVRGWRHLAEQAAMVREAVPTPDRTFFLAPRDRYVASALAFYLPDQPRTFCWEDPAHPESQYGIWGRPLDRVGWDAIVLEENPESPRVAEIAGLFGTWEARGEIVVPLGAENARNRRYAVFLGRGFDPGKAAVEGGPE